MGKTKYLIIISPFLLSSCISIKDIKEDIKKGEAIDEKKVSKNDPIFKKNANKYEEIKKVPFSEIEKAEKGASKKGRKKPSKKDSGGITNNSPNNGGVKANLMSRSNEIIDNKIDGYIVKRKLSNGSHNKKYNPQGKNIKRVYKGGLPTTQSRRDRGDYKYINVKRISGGGVMFEVSENALFLGNSPTISDKGKRILREIKKVFDSGKYRINVIGHTNSAKIGERDKNLYPSTWELSSAKASAVIRYFDDELKVPKKYLSATGVSFSMPIAPNSTERGREINKRVEIILVPFGVGLGKKITKNRVSKEKTIWSNSPSGCGLREVDKSYLYPLKCDNIKDIQLGEIHFRKGEFNLTEDQKNRLTTVVKKVLRHGRIKSLNIYSYAIPDEVDGKMDKVFLLSKKRALSVARQLVSCIRTDKINVINSGNKNLESPTWEDTENAKNRKVSIELITCDEIDL